jgi:hypothetical protein
MDRFRNVSRFLRKYHFWILCVIIAALGLGSWWFWSGQFLVELQANSRDTETARKKGMEVLAIAPHPNQQYHEEMEKLNEARAKDIVTAWQRKWEQQGERILVWPQTLGEDFIATVKDVVRGEAIESIDQLDPNRQLPIQMRERYRDFIKSELPKLAEIIGARWAPADQAPVGALRDEAADLAIVDWNSSNQSVIQSERFDWSREGNKVPTTLQVLYAQEDLWVLTALMNIIRNTNQGATARHQAAVKAIDDIQIGSAAAGLQGAISKTVGTAPNTSTPSTAHASPPPSGQTSTGPDPADHRYVDKDYVPLTAEVLRGAAKSQKPEDAYLTVAKRMPVRMKLVVDQRRLNDLLIQCGNSPLTVEVRQVRILPGSDSARSRPSSGAAHGASRLGVRETESARGAEFTFDVNVEIYAIIYVFNPVNYEKLGFTKEQALALAREVGDTRSDEAVTGTSAGGGTTTPPPVPAPAATTPPATTPPATTPPATTPPATTPPATTPPATTPPAEPAPAAPAEGAPSG